MSTIEYRAADRPPVGGFRPDLGHLAVWVVVAVVSMAAGLYACIRYNEIAGTDLTAPEIAARTVGMNAGPLGGPAWLWPVPVAVLALGWLPFLVLRRRPGPAARVIVRLVNALAAAVWYASAVVSLGIRLS